MSLDEHEAHAAPHSTSREMGGERDEVIEPGDFTCDVKQADDFTCELTCEFTCDTIAQM
jgi:hypothetical protein